MLMLSLSTSGPVASAAIIRDADIMAACTGPQGQTHSETIPGLCEKLLQEAGLALSDMDAIAADAGPGSFTGVRIGVCAANAMAAAMNIPVTWASSLEGLIYGMDNACALIDCRNGNGYAMVRSPGFHLDPSPVVIRELLDKLQNDILIAGDGAQLHRDLILSMIPGAVLQPGHADAGRIGLAALSRLSEANGPVSPLYLRPSQAERMAKEAKS